MFAGMDAIVDCGWVSEALSSSGRDPAAKGCLGRHRCPGMVDQASRERRVARAHGRQGIARDGCRRTASVLIDGAMGGGHREATGLPIVAKPHLGLGSTPKKAVANRASVDEPKPALGTGPVECWKTGKTGHADAVAFAVNGHRVLPEVVAQHGGEAGKPTLRSVTPAGSGLSIQVR